MFSGIVEGLKKPIIFKKSDQSIELTLPIPKNWKLKIGDSINIDGICSTIKSISKNTFSVFYMAETLNKTHLRSKKENHQFNLQASLTLNSIIGGHLVSGHVDTTARVEKIRQAGESKVIKFKLNKEFTKYIIYKGSICVNGVSLTIVDVGGDFFVVSLIPYTLDNTNLGILKVGDIVNIEVDLMAKYLEKFLQPYLEKVNKK